MSLLPIVVSVHWFVNVERVFGLFATIEGHFLFTQPRSTPDLSRAHLFRPFLRVVLGSDLVQDAGYNLFRGILD